MVLNKYLFYILFLAIFFNNSPGFCQNNKIINDPTAEIIIIDSDLSYDEALSGLEIPEEIKKHLALIDVEYIGYDGFRHKGQIVIHEKHADDLVDIFEEILDSRFPIERVKPIVLYGWSDDSSMADNNSSGFNYRTVPGSRKLSDHALGIAVDINPLYNPWITRSGRVYPRGSAHNPEQKGTILAGSEIVNSFTKRGWYWGGYWGRSKDYQHFYKK